MAKAEKERQKKVTKADKVKKGPSPYNIFMGNEIQKVKKDNSSLDHKEAFRTAAANWAKSSENPKNKK